MSDKCESVLQWEQNDNELTQKFNKKRREIRYFCIIYDGPFCL